jgi:aspartyl-tRNA(Asn)/glutamyl-tRNA(Gln) amidotransferase subunit C
MNPEPSQPGRAEIDVAYVAHLARMHLSDEEIARFQPQLAQIVDHVRQIQSLDTSDVEPTAHAIEIRNVARADTRREGLSADVAMRNAPQNKEDLFVVPKIVE